MGKAVRQTGRAATGSARPRLGEILAADGVLTAGAARRAARFAKRHGQPIGTALITSGAATPAAVARALARQRDLPFADLAREPPDPALTRPADFTRLAALRAVPWRRGSDGRIVYACAEPDSATQSALGALAGRPAAMAAADMASVITALEAAHGRRLADDAALAYAAASPSISAHTSVRPRAARLRLAAITAAALTGLVALASVPAIGTAAVLGLSALYAVLTLFRLALIAVQPQALPPAQEPRSGALPRYTVIVALHDEAPVIPALMAALEGLDYPRDRLEVLLVTEAADATTRAAIGKAGLDRHATVLTVPEGQPRTKPRALNYALAFARGDLVGVFDAEDRPERDQLRKAAAAFAEGGPRLACVQARLAFYNAGETCLTKLFALDYALWFGRLLPPFARFGWPVPLGGTSNHMRREALVALGGWDSHNVTEDADLGMRLARAGWHVAMLDSVTWEEAPVTTSAWIRQRSRWLKGHAVTVLCHLRRPGPLVAAAGVGGTLAITAFLAGGVITGFVNPALWIMTVLVLLGLAGTVPPLPEVFAPVAPAAAAIGNAALIVAMALGSRLGTGAKGLAPWAMLTPLYWIWMAAAAWKGLGGLVLAPVFWEKTGHRALGVAVASQRLRTGGASGITRPSPPGLKARQHGARA